jgi:hypothetical protein
MQAISRRNSQLTIRVGWLEEINRQLLSALALSLYAMTGDPALALDVLRSVEETLEARERPEAATLTPEIIVLLGPTV